MPAFLLALPPPHCRDARRSGLPPSHLLLRAGTHASLPTSSTASCPRAGASIALPRAPEITAGRHFATAMASSEQSPSFYPLVRSSTRKTPALYPACSLWFPDPRPQNTTASAMATVFL